MTQTIYAGLSLVLGEEKVMIELRDQTSDERIFKGYFKGEDLLKLLRGQVNIQCHGQIFETSRLGKKLETQQLRVPVGTDRWVNSEMRADAKKKVEEACPPGWIVEGELTDKRSFDHDGTTLFAVVTAKRWVEGDS